MNSLLAFVLRLFHWYRVARGLPILASLTCLSQ